MLLTLPWQQLLTRVNNFDVSFSIIVIRGIGLRGGKGTEYIGPSCEKGAHKDTSRNSRGCGEGPYRMPVVCATPLTVMYNY